jgi:hypothetical protein
MVGWGAPKYSWGVIPTVDRYMDLLSTVPRPKAAGGNANLMVSIKNKNSLFFHSITCDTIINIVALYIVIDTDLNVENIKHFILMAVSIHLLKKDTILILWG